MATATPPKQTPDDAGLEKLLYDALETELGGVRIYETALRCARNLDLRREWTQYLDETRAHVQVLLTVFARLGLDPEAAKPGRRVVDHIGRSLVAAMEMALAAGDGDAAERVACECVVLAETKDHQNWELIGHLVEHGEGERVDALRDAYERVEDQEDHHLYHTRGWSRELWIAALGLPAALPPPEEVMKVESAIGAVRAEHARDSLTKQ